MTYFIFRLDSKVIVNLIKYLHCCSLIWESYDDVSGSVLDVQSGSNALIRNEGSSRDY